MPSTAVVSFAGGAYLWDMKKFRLLLLLASCTSLLMTSCSVPPNAEEDPNADAAYKRAHRTEMYRKAQSSEPSIQQ
jgi:hypothetical protein